MNGDKRLHFVPEIGHRAVSAHLTFGRPPHRRLWRGCAARLAGAEADRRSGPRGTRTNVVRQFASASDMGGMKRKQTAVNFFTERSLAAYLAVSDRTIRNWIRRGELPSYKLGAARRIDPADVEVFLARHRDEAA
jgi:excisionase family DNA binding protein